MPSFSREEIQSALDHYAIVADQAAKSGDWGPWAELFTEDCTYIEHVYGEFHGREEVLAWISKTMGVFPFTKMNAFPWDWYTIDAEQGWVIGHRSDREPIRRSGRWQGLPGRELDPLGVRRQWAVVLGGGHLQPDAFPAGRRGLARRVAAAPPRRAERLSSYIRPLKSNRPESMPAWKPLSAIRFVPFM
jgi:hypothetical protein